MEQSIKPGEAAAQHRLRPVYLLSGTGMRVCPLNNG